jgi:hypothetical protein
VWRPCHVCVHEAMRSSTSKPCPPEVAVFVPVRAAGAITVPQACWRAWLRLIWAAGIVRPNSAGFMMLGA